MEEIKMGFSESGRRASSVSTISISVLSVDSEAPSMSSSRSLSLSPLERLVKIQSEAEFYLRNAMMNERARRWSKVADSYQTMLKLMARPNMPPGFRVTDSYVMLLYESYYHLGVALQNLARHKEAVKAYTQAMKTVNIHKNGCLAGCNANSCFQTPVLAKRAFAHARAGDMKSAFCDIEKAVVLDTRNPDLYCIRALLWNTNKDTEKAVDDLNRALRYNPCHVCALLLRGTMDQPFRITFNFLDGLSFQNNAKEMKKDHMKAKQINGHAVQFLDVADIHSPKLIDLWNRFLWSLNVPRNIVHAELMDGYDCNLAAQQNKPERGKCKRNISRSTTPVIQVNGVPDSGTVEDSENDASGGRVRCLSPRFRCGTPTVYRHASNAKRRHSYGEALRTYSNVLKVGSNGEFAVPTRPHTATSLRGHTTRSSSPVAPSVLSRPSSDRQRRPRPSVTFSQPLLIPPTERRKGTVSAPPSLARPQSRRSSITPTLPAARRASLAVVPVTTLSLTSDLTSVRTKQDAANAKQRSASEYVHKMHGLRVFEPLNLDDAPRMYYKPWTGDKLPVVEVARKQTAPSFRV